MPNTRLAIARPTCGAAGAAISEFVSITVADLLKHTCA
jgi:hypothetical protein